jgi:hypothetical protein
MALLSATPDSGIYSTAVTESILAKSPFEQAVNRLLASIGEYSYTERANAIMICNALHQSPTCIPQKEHFLKQLGCCRAMCPISRSLEILRLQTPQTMMLSASALDGVEGITS